MNHGADPIWRKSDTTLRVVPGRALPLLPHVCDDVLVADDVTPPAAPAGQPRMERRHRRTVLWVIVATQLCLAVLTGAGVWLGYGRLSGNIADGEDIDHAVAAPEEDKPNRPINILVMGEDTRAGEGNAIDGETGGGGSDTTILLHLSADRETAYGVSLPRDAMVARPECESGGETIPAEDPVMFNTAFALGGPRCTVKMVEELTGIYIDHFVVLDFNGFKAMVEAVDGVEVCIPEDVDDDEHNIHFEAGTQLLDGDQALNYVRERTVLSVTGDIGRMKRQQAFMASMINRVMSAGTLSRPNRIYSFLDAVTDSIRVDADLDSLPAMVDLVREFRHTGLSDIRFVTVPIAEYEPDPNRLVWTRDAEDLWRRIINDRPLGRAFDEDSLSADDPVGTASGDPDPSASGSQDPSESPAASPDDDADTEAEAAERLANGLCA